MATLDLRGSTGTLRLSPNGGNATIRSFLILGAQGLPGANGRDGLNGRDGAQGLPGPPGPAVTVGAGDIIVTDNNDGTASVATAIGLVDNNDGTATIAG